ncbi:MAG: LPXTG cell wall anchor domain-containing protein [Rubrobacter sp.]|nr:LPXTG cell wall anchor domain-containing protein [Rubrobacter sp.]
MSKVFGTSGYMVRGRRKYPLMLALVACLIWVSAAQAQEAPFNSQYDPPPTIPPGCEGDDGGDGDGGSDPGASGGSEGSGEQAGDPNWGCDDPQVLSDTEGPIDILPTTGGLIAAPILLGMAMIVAAGIFTVRRKR